MRFIFFLIATVFIASISSASPKRASIKVYRGKDTINITAKTRYRIYRINLKKTSRPLIGKVISINSNYLREKPKDNAEFFIGRLKDGGHGSAVIRNSEVLLNFEDKKSRRFVEIRSGKNITIGTHSRRKSLSSYCMNASPQSFSISEVKPKSFPYEVYVTAISDLDFFNRFGEEVPTKIERVFNFVNSIYQQQLGITVKLNNIFIYETEEDFLLKSDINELLGSFRRAGNRLKPWGSADLFHLFTAKELTPEGYIGLAYVGAACAEKRFSYGLTKWVSSPIFPVITAHELAHNLNATHTSEGIMQADLSSNPRNFSEFSKNEIFSFLQTSSTCLSPLSYEGTLLNQSINGEFNEKFEITGESSRRCSLELYLGDNRSKLRIGITKKRGELVAKRSKVAVGDTFQFQAPYREGKPSLALFSRGVLKCGKTTLYTEITPLRIRAKSYPWLVRYLKRSLAG